MPPPPRMRPPPRTPPPPAPPTPPPAQPPSVSNTQVRNCLCKGSHPIRWVPLSATLPSILTSNCRIRNEPLSDHEQVVETSSSSLSFTQSPSIHSRSFRRSWAPISGG